MAYKYVLRGNTYTFQDLKAVLAKASPQRSGDALAGIAAEDTKERIAAQYCLSEIPLKTFLEDLVIPYENDEVTRLIIDSHDPKAFQSISGLTVGEFRDYLLSYQANGDTLKNLSPGLTPEMLAAVSKIMRNQDLIAVAQKIEVVTKFRNTVGKKRTFFG